MDPYWPPFSFREDGESLVGFDVDLLGILNARLGVTFEIVEAENWEALVGMARRGEVDVLFSTADSPERREFLFFSRPYVDFPMAVITRRESPFLLSVESLAGQRVSVPRDYVYFEWLRRNHPEITIVPTESNEEALVLAARGEVDATVANLANASHYIRARGLTNLKIAGIADKSFELRLAVRRDWPELVPLLDRAILSLAPEEEAALLAKWVYVEHEDLIVWSRVLPYVWGAAGVATLTIVFFVLWNRRLSREVRRRRMAEEQLLCAQARLTGLNEEKSQVMNMVAHDVRGPLTNILCRLDLVGHGGYVDIAKFRRARDEIKAQVRRVNRLLERLLVVNALESGSFEPTFERVEAVSLVRETVDGHRGPAQSKSISLEERFPEVPAYLESDRSALAGIVGNLVSNAIKYTPRGGRVTVALESRGGYVAVRVADTGPGFDDEDKARLYQKFTTLSARPTGGENSFGLGLAIAKHYVDVLGGRIHCESKPGEGAVFSVELPVGRAKAGAGGESGSFGCGKPLAGASMPL